MIFNLLFLALRQKLILLGEKKKSNFLLDFLK